MKIRPAQNNSQCTSATPASILEFLEEIGAPSTSGLLLFSSKGKLLYINKTAHLYFQELPLNHAYSSINEFLQNFSSANPVQVTLKQLNKNGILLISPGKGSANPAQSISLHLIRNSLDELSGGTLAIIHSYAKMDEDNHHLHLMATVACKTHNPVIYTNADRSIVWVNEAFTKNTGFTLDEVKGKVPGQVLQGKETDKRVIAKMRNKLAKKLPFEYVLQNYHKDGTEIWMKVNVQPIFNEKGELLNFLGIASNITNQVKLEKKLEIQKRNEERKLIKMAIESQETERNAIGRELHDNINQLLSITILYNDLLNGAPDRMDIIEKQRALLQLCVHEIRSLSHRLVTPQLGQDFKESVSDLVVSVKISSDIKINFHNKLTDKDILTSDIQLNIFRIIQEQMTNILKHANCSEITILIFRQGPGLKLTIIDNGQGIDPENLEGGIGIQNMQNRAKLINGTISIKTEKGNGFQLTLLVENCFSK